jgi:hypothetical protein
MERRKIIMKSTILVLLVSLSSLPFAQKGFRLGVEVSPSWVLNAHRNKTTTIRTFESGYGFNVGLPLKYHFNEYSGIESGLSFEYYAFDNRANNILVSSNRFASIHLPLTYLYQITGDWYAHFGGGIRYQIMNRAWSGWSVDISPVVNRVQPYLALGASTFLERDNGMFELGLMTRYHFINLWKESAPQAAGSTSKIVSFDLLLRFYFINP